MTRYARSTKRPLPPLSCYLGFAPQLTVRVHKSLRFVFVKRSFDGMGFSVLFNYSDVRTETKRKRNARELLKTLNVRTFSSFTSINEVFTASYSQTAATTARSTISIPRSREYHVTNGVAKRELVSSSLVV